VASQSAFVDRFPLLGFDRLSRALTDVYSLKSRTHTIGGTKASVQNIDAVLDQLSVSLRINPFVVKLSAVDNIISHPADAQ
jgi:hypothetical protein